MLYFPVWKIGPALCRHYAGGHQHPGYFLWGADRHHRHRRDLLARPAGPVRHDRLRLYHCGRPAEDLVRQYHHSADHLGHGADRGRDGIRRGQRAGPQGPQDPGAEGASHASHHRAFPDCFSLRRTGQQPHDHAPAVVSDPGRHLRDVRGGEEQRPEAGAAAGHLHRGHGGLCTALQGRAPLLHRHHQRHYGEQRAALQQYGLPGRGHAGGAGLRAGLHAVHPLCLEDRPDPAEGVRRGQDGADRGRPEDDRQAEDPLRLHAVRHRVPAAGHGSAQGQRRL